MTEPGLIEGIRNALIYSKSRDTWRCSNVTIYGQTVNKLPVKTYPIPGRWFFYSQDTDESGRNSSHAGKSDNPITFNDFELSWNGPCHWMGNNIDVIGDKELHQICMPGAHDAGMYFSQHSTYFGGTAMTLTQERNIYKMLCLGVRFFDIRPIIGSDEYWTGHYSHIPGSFQGARGDSIDNIIQQINNFTSHANELIILDVSHDMNTDKGYRHFTKEEYIALLDKFCQINDLRFIGNSPSSALVNGSISNGKSSVIIRVDCSQFSNEIPEKYTAAGIITMNNYPIYNKYANTSSWEKMWCDQLCKMENGHYNFLLSWTCTQNKAEAEGFGASIIDLAKGANKRLEKFADECIFSNNPNTHTPSVILQDDITDSTAVNICMRINRGLSGTGESKPQSVSCPPCS